MRCVIALLALLILSSSAYAGKIVGEDASYAREMGFEAKFFYVASGDGAGQIEYICRAFPGTTASSSTANAVWQVQRFTYDSSNRISTIAFAGDDDAFNQICDNRTSLDYD
jgi:hypothetical protein